MNDLTGRKFGKLTAIKPVGHNSCGQILWECACECGGTSVSASSNLLRGTTRSCGCLAHLVKDLTGRKFGKLTVIRQVEKKVETKNRCASWLCRCECGRETTVDSNALVTGNTKSCGDCSWGTYEFTADCVIGHFENDETFLLDFCDYHVVRGYRWWVDKSSGYFVTNVNGRLAYLHRMLMPDCVGLICDHINRDKHDNRRVNLRYATPKENSRNRSLARNNTSGYIGVSWHIRQKKWVAAIKADNRAINLGSFDTAEEAARARDKAALLCHGDFAHLNFGGDQNETRDTRSGEELYAADIAV